MQLVYEEDVVFRCGARTEELCQGEMELPGVCTEDVELHAGRVGRCGVRGGCLREA
jgi:hypothetical protein